MFLLEEIGNFDELDGSNLRAHERRTRDVIPIMLDRLVWYTLVALPT